MSTYRPAVRRAAAMKATAQKAALNYRSNTAGKKRKTSRKKAKAVTEE